MLSRIYCTTNQPIIKHGFANIHTSTTVEAARKGTRLRRDAIKRAMKRKKIEVVKKEFIPASKRKELEKLKLLKTTTGPTREPIDNVYAKHFFKEPLYSISEALLPHRQICHPTTFNQPDALVTAFMQLSLKLDRKNRYIAAFTGMLNMPHKFEVQNEERNILVLTTNPTIAEDVRALGVENVVGLDVLKLVKSHKLDLNEFTHVICDVHMLPDLTGMRPIFKKNFPNVADGTAVVDVPNAVKKFLNGIEYAIVKSKYDPNSGTINAHIGRLTMSDDELEQNLRLLLTDIYNRQPKTRAKSMIDKIVIKCPPSTENREIEYRLYMPQAM